MMKIIWYSTLINIWVFTFGAKEEKQAQDQSGFHEKLFILLVQHRAQAMLKHDPEQAANMAERSINPYFI